MVNWNTVLSVVGKETLQQFAEGDITYRGLTNEAAFTEAAPEVRKLLRGYGTDKARQLTRKALSRRV